MIIDDLPSISIANDSDEIAIEQGTATKKITKGNFLQEVTSAISSLLSSLSGKVSKAGDTMSGNLTVASADPRVYVKNTNMDTTLSSDTANRVTHFGLRDKNDRYIGYIQGGFSTDGLATLAIKARKRVNGADVDNGLSMRVSKTGVKSVEVDDSAAWRDALGLGTSGALPITVAQGGTGQTEVTSVTTASSIVTAASGITVSSAAYYQWGKVAQLRVQFKKTTAQTTDGIITLGTLVSGKRPINLAPATCNLQSLQPSYISSAGVIYVYGTVSANTEFGVLATYILP